jgi:hypothetical protein
MKRRRGRRRRRRRRRDLKAGCELLITTTALQTVI